LFDQQQQHPSAAPTFHDLNQKLHILVKNLELVKTNFIPLNKVAIKKVCKKHAKYAGGSGSSVEIENYRITITKTIQEERAWWKKGKSIVSELLKEAKVNYLDFSEIIILDLKLVLFLYLYLELSVGIM
jgi:hypothetical protein